MTYSVHSVANKLSPAGSQLPGMPLVDPALGGYVSKYVVNVVSSAVGIVPQGSAALAFDALAQRLITRSRPETSTLLVALVYMNRAKSSLAALPSPNASLVRNVSKFAYYLCRLMLVGPLILADKYLHDCCWRSSEWAQFSGIPKSDIFQIERWTLRLTKYKLSFRAECLSAQYGAFQMYRTLEANLVTRPGHILPLPDFVDYAMRTEFVAQPDYNLPSFESVDLSMGTVSQASAVKLEEFSSTGLDLLSVSASAIGIDVSISGDAFASGHLDDMAHAASGCSAVCLAPPTSCYQTLVKQEEQVAPSTFADMSWTPSELGFDACTPLSAVDPHSSGCSVVCLAPPTSCYQTLVKKEEQAAPSTFADMSWTPSELGFDACTPLFAVDPHSTQTYDDQWNLSPHDPLWYESCSAPDVKWSQRVPSPSVFVPDPSQCTLYPGIYPQHPPLYIC